jgi:hypothetical protein
MAHILYTTHHIQGRYRVAFAIPVALVMASIVWVVTVLGERPTFGVDWDRSQMAPPASNSVPAAEYPWSDWCQRRLYLDPFATGENGPTPSYGCLWLFGGQVADMAAATADGSPRARVTSHSTRIHPLSVGTRVLGRWHAATVHFLCPREQA